MNKILIIKTGHSETWINDQSEIVSFGDVFRTTTLLKNFTSDQVDWLGSKESSSLLDSSQKISFLEWSEHFQNLDFRKYSLVINLEKHPALQPILFENYSFFIGFFFDHKNKEWLLKNHEREIFSLAQWHEHCHRNLVKTWGEKLQFLLGAPLQSSMGVINIDSNKTSCDFGLNWQVGKKWPLKQIEKENWNKIFEVLSKNYSVSWQEGFNSINEYKSWLAKNKVVISLDSLGMHLALAMNKPTLAIFTVTSPEDVDTNPHSIFYTTSDTDINFNFIVDSAIKLLHGKYDYSSRAL